MAAWDARNGSVADLPNNIDVTASRSLDDGVTWTTPATVSQHTGGDTQSTANGCGDTCLLVDPTTGRIFAHYLYAPAGIGYANSAAGNTGTVRPTYRYSDDDGVTWSDPVDLTDALKTPTTYGIFATSGHGWTLTDGTLCIPYTYATSTDHRGFIAYSTDHGATWQRGADIVDGSPGEFHGVQLADGSLLISARPSAGSGRLFYTAPSVNGPWMLAQRPDLPDPSCNGDIINVAGNLLVSGCASTSTRANLTVWLSTDNGATWPASWRVFDGAAAYSSLIQLDGGSAGIFWEDNTHGIMQFTRFDLGDLR